jgi:glycerol-3-phosphate O-acyltransferase
MHTDIWHSVAGGKLIVLLDAAHRVERRLLQQWLSECFAEHGKPAQLQEVVLNIARSPESPDASQLASLLPCDEDTCVLPVRVVWRTSLDSKTIRPRARDLLFGNPRLPGTWRARRILAQHPGRAISSRMMVCASSRRDSTERPVCAESASSAAPKRGLRRMFTATRRGTL